MRRPNPLADSNNDIMNLMHKMYANNYCVLEMNVFNYVNIFGL